MFPRSIVAFSALLVLRWEGPPSHPDCIGSRRNHRSRGPSARNWFKVTELFRAKLAGGISHDFNAVAIVGAMFGIPIGEPALADGRQPVRLGEFGP